MSNLPGCLRRGDLAPGGRTARGSGRIDFELDAVVLRPQVTGAVSAMPPQQSAIGVPIDDELRQVVVERLRGRSGPMSRSSGMPVEHGAARCETAAGRRGRCRWSRSSGPPRVSSTHRPRCGHQSLISIPLCAALPVADLERINRWRMCPLASFGQHDPHVLAERVRQDASYGVSAIVLPAYLFSAGLGSKLSRWLIPPSMNSQITFLALGGKCG